jgi:hypothetical protein
VRLTFKPGEAAQVDFGAGPFLVHPDGQRRRTWAFVMTLCHSRHQYVEFVLDQTVATWLGCHRRAFEWLAGVPERVIIDNAKCAIPELVPHLKQLRLSGILDSLDARNRQAIESKLAYTEFLAIQMGDEVARREQNSFSTRLRRA